MTPTTTAQNRRFAALRHLDRCQKEVDRLFHALPIVTARGDRRATRMANVRLKRAVEARAAAKAALEVL